MLVAGLTAQDLEKKLASILNEKSTKDAHVTVFIKEYQKIAVLGAVGRPGLYEMTGPTSLLKIISQAGGFTAEAMNELYVYRKDADGKKLNFTIDIQALFGGNQDLDIDLQPNDEVDRSDRSDIERLRLWRGQESRDGHVQKVEEADPSPSRCPGRRSHGVGFDVQDRDQKDRQSHRARNG